MGRTGQLRVDFQAARGKRVLAALSGGADSTALLCLLAEAREALGIELHATHLDHAIRPESAGDARWCAGLCRQLNVPFHTRRVDVPAEAARAGEGLESAARRVRYDYLMELRAELGADLIALAHHMDDQAETVLMHLCRGAGMHGMGGMDTLSGVLYRPLLGVRHEELTAYLTAQGQDWREDATNAHTDNPRNALRHNALPALEAVWPGAVPAIARFAAVARMEDDYLAGEMRAWLKANAVPLGETPPGDGIAPAKPQDLSHQSAFFVEAASDSGAACADRWLDLSTPPHPALLRRAIRRLTGDAVGWERVNAAAALADQQRGRVELSGQWAAERGRNGLYLLSRPACRAAEAPRPLALSGETALPGLCRIEARACAPVPVRDNPMRQAVCATALRGAEVRTRQSGDRFRPLGCGDRLLSDFLIDRGVDRPLRDRIALVARGNRVLWVCGVGISEDIRLTSPQDDAVRLTCRYAFDIARPLRLRVPGEDAR